MNENLFAYAEGTRYARESGKCIYVLVKYHKDNRDSVSK